MGKKQSGENDFRHKTVHVNRKWEGGKNGDEDWEVYYFPMRLCSLTFSHLIQHSGLIYAIATTRVAMDDKKKCYITDISDSHRLNSEVIQVWLCVSKRVGTGFLTY